MLEDAVVEVSEADEPDALGVLLHAGRVFCQEEV